MRGVLIPDSKKSLSPVRRISTFACMAARGFGRLQLCLVAIIEKKINVIYCVSVSAVI